MLESVTINPTRGKSSPTYEFAPLIHKPGRLFPGPQVFACRHAMGGMDLTEGDLKAVPYRAEQEPGSGGILRCQDSRFPHPFPFFTIVNGEQFAEKRYFFSTGYLLSSHSFQPPLSTETFLKPALASSCATRALVPSWGQAQYKTIFWSLEYLPIHSLASAGTCRCAPFIFQWLESQSWLIRMSITITSGFVSSSLN